MNLNKLIPETTTGKIVAGTAVAGALTLGAFTISKKAEQRRVSETEGAYNKKYPLSNNCTELKIFIDRANLELTQLESLSGGDRGAKRIRQRNLDALKVRIEQLQKQFNTLDCANQLASIGESLPQAGTESKGMTQYIWYGVAAIAAILLFTNLSKKD